MFQSSGHDTTHSAGAAVLPLDRRIASIPELGRLRQWRHWFEELDLVVDLGVRVGSREWWRGLATCSALCITAWSLRPDISTIEGVIAPPMPPAQWDEARSTSITPLAMGGDTGRRMAPTQTVEMLGAAPERPSLDLTATIGQGDSFARTLERAGVSETEAVAISNTVSRHVATSDILPGTRIEITLGRRPGPGMARPLDYLSFRAKFDLRITIERVNGNLVTRPIPIAVDSTPLRIQGRVGNGLFLSARAAGAPAKAIETYLRVLATKISLDDGIDPDDRFDIIVAHRRAETGETENGDLLYAGFTGGTRKLQLVRWATDNGPQYYDASGVGEKRGLMRAPVAGHLTSTFGMRRHPLLGYVRFHRGVDFGAPYGSPIMASASGVVQLAGHVGGYGNQVRVDHGNGLATSYSHMSRIAVTPGAMVRQGQIIGYVGSTGLSTGPHLHYEMYRNGTAINPLSVSFTTTSLLSGQELASFKATLARLLAVPIGGGNAMLAGGHGGLTPAAAAATRTPGAIASPVPSRAGSRPAA